MKSLRFYPYVKLRVSCPCGYRKACRLARVAEHYGADIALDERRANIAAINQIQFMKSQWDTVVLRTSCELVAK
jgi:hypothetical protein